MEIVAYSIAAAAAAAVAVAEPSNLAFVGSIAFVAVAGRDQDKAVAADQYLLRQIQ